MLSFAGVRVGDLVMVEKEFSKCETVGLRELSHRLKYLLQLFVACGVAFGRFIFSALLFERDVGIFFSPPRSLTQRSTLPFGDREHPRKNGTTGVVLIDARKDLFERELSGVFGLCWREKPRREGAYDGKEDPKRGLERRPIPALETLKVAFELTSSCFFQPDLSTGGVLLRSCLCMIVMELRAARSSRFAACGSRRATLRSGDLLIGESRGGARHEGEGRKGPKLTDAFFPHVFVSF